MPAPAVIAAVAVWIVVTGAAAATDTATAAKLFDPSGSLVPELAVAESAIVPAPPVLTITVIVAELPVASVPRLQLTMPPEGEGQAPALGVAETKEVLDGSVSTTVTEGAASGPPFETANVNVTGWLGVEAVPAAVIERSADDPAAMVAFLFARVGPFPAAANPTRCADNRAARATAHSHIQARPDRMAIRG
jgi:hypothetical protein